MSRCKEGNQQRSLGIISEKVSKELGLLAWQTEGWGPVFKYWESCHLSQRQRLGSTSDSHRQTGGSEEKSGCLIVDSKQDGLPSGSGAPCIQKHLTRDCVGTCLVVKTEPMGAGRLGEVSSRVPLPMGGRTGLIAPLFPRLLVSLRSPRQHSTQPRITLAP